MMIFVREELESLLFDIAVESAKKAVEGINRDDIKKMRNEMRHSLVAIVMCHLSLEALINSIGMLYYGNQPNPEKQKEWKNIEGLEFVKKWKHLAMIAHQEKTKTKQKKTLCRETTQLLSELAKLRDSIVHYKAVPVNKSRLRRTSKNNVVSPELEKYTSEAAKKAIKTVIEVIKAFNNLAGKEYGEWRNTILEKHSMKV